MMDFHELVQQVGVNEPAHSRLVAYYEGRQPLAYLSPDAAEALDNRLHLLSANIARLVVDSIAERLRITGFTDASVWPHWEANRGATLAQTVHIEALMLGEAYVAVWAAGGRPVVTAESATRIAADLDPATGAVRAAVKLWEADGATHAVHYLPDEIVRYRASQAGARAGFTVEARLDNPLDQVPLVRFRNGDRLTHRGVSEMCDVMPLTDALTKLLADMLVTSEDFARPRRWATGLELREDDDGNETYPVNEASNKILVTEETDARFGQFPGADLGGYERAIGVVMRTISAVTGLPEHLLGIGGDNPSSADAIRASEAALTAKAEARQRLFAAPWGQVAALVRAAATGQDPARLATAPIWCDPATRSEAQTADATVKLVQAGILPRSWALKRLGYTSEEIARIDADRRREALADAAMRLGAS